MGDNDKLTVREQEAKKRKETLESYAFRFWWAERQKHGPIPTDPYRAFMIDKGLKASLEDREHWTPTPNRKDLPLIDYPFGKWTYTKRQRKISPPAQREVKAEPSGKKTPHREIADLMEKEVGLPAKIPIYNTGRGPLRSHAKAGVTVIGTSSDHFGQIFVASKNNSPQSLAATAHEAGHVAHAQATFGRTKKPLPPNIKPFSAVENARKKGSARMDSVDTYNDEVAAWRYADTILDKVLAKGPPLKAQPTKTPTYTRDKKPILYEVDLSKNPRAQASWLKAYALKSYREGARLRGTPIKIGKDGFASFK